MSFGDLSTGHAGFGMADDTDGLYPPDAGHPTPEDRSRRMRTAVGTGLVVAGLALLIERALGLSLHFGPFAVGAGLLAGWLQVRRYGWFVGGAVVTGFGAGALVHSVMTGVPATMLSSFGAALGFLAVFVRYPHRSTWALIAAAFFGIVGATAGGVALLGLLPHVAANILLPVVVIGAGALLLLRGRLPSQVVRVGVVVLAILFLALAGSN
ncbi:MAG TPA: hypothetical protein VHN98_03760 [Acidimicrobiales bacterium]|nr:hypothetical protein [Acidimicrobiales bacterium]